MAKETNQILGHGDEADGIEEYDNPLPDWWLGLFFLTVVYGIGYTFAYHFVFDDSQEKRYLAEMAAAEEKWPTPEGPLEFVMDEATVSAGAGVYAQTCASCHGAELQGGIGPSLVDAEWIHGDKPEQIMATVTNGIADKGMPAWGPVLGPLKVQQVSAFVVSKKGSAPAIPAGPTPQPDTPAEPSGEDAATDAGSADPTPEVDGAAIYTANCAACHGPEMKGVVGPSLVDDEWIHGSELEQIKAIITAGVPEKGMVSWGPILGEQKIDLVARFVHMQATKTNNPDATN